MVKGLLLRWVLQILVMIGLPWLAVTFAPGDAGMAVCFLLFYAVNPMFVVILGYFSGKDERPAWRGPLMPALLFLLGTWLFFDRGEPAFYWYALVYYLLGLLAMGMRVLLRRKQ